MSDVEITVSSSPASGMSDLYDLLPDVAIEAPGCPDAMQKQALRIAAREFCRDTEIWREVLTTTSTEDEDEYDLNALHSYDAEVYRLLSVELDSSDVDATDYTYDAEGTLTFDTAPDADDEAIELNVVMLPYMTCDEYPSYLLRQWREGIVAQALYRLKIQAKKPWSDPDGAILKKDEYRYQCALAKGTVVTGREGGNLRVQARDFV